MTMTKRDWSFAWIWWALGLAYLGLLAHFSLSHEEYARPSSESVPLLDKYLHCLAYAMPAAGFVQLVRSVPRTFAGLFAFGLLMEFLQAAGGLRTFQYSDILANSSGALVGSWISLKYGRDWLWKLDQGLKRHRS